jgi:hypothetical protein
VATEGVESRQGNMNGTCTEGAEEARGGVGDVMLRS